MIKFARKWGWLNGGRNEIICMDNSFHGRTLGTLAATGRTKYREGFGPDMQGFSFANLNDLDSVKKLITDKTVAVMLEPVQGEGGVLPVTRDFICGVRKLCDDNKLLLLLDEVQCGMGRTGTYFAYERFGVKPDAMTIAKAIANGLPMGVFEVRQEYGDVLQPGNHGTTFGGNPLISAVACEVFDIMRDEDVIENVRTQSWRFFNALNDLQKQYDFIRDVRGHGQMDFPTASALARPIYYIGFFRDHLEDFGFDLNGQTTQMLSLLRLRQIVKENFGGEIPQDDAEKVKGELAALREMADVHPSVLLTDLLINDAVAGGRHHDVSGVFTDKREDKLRIKAPSAKRMKPKKRVKK